MCLNNGTKDQLISRDVKAARFGSHRERGASLRVCGDVHLVRSSSVLGSKPSFVTAGSTPVLKSPSTADTSSAPTLLWEPRAFHVNGDAGDAD